jgi:pSer/pThr/pTyr-binding forkhead associated (FHA) protein
MSSVESSTGSVIVNLLDVGRRQTLQTWQFDSVAIVTIGRSPEREIVIPDGKISRLHVVLQHRDCAWYLMSMGQNGVQIDGEMVDDFPLVHGTTFRLGRQGPVLEFCNVAVDAEPLANTAVEIRLEAADQIQLDQQKLNDEVKEIVDGDFFQTLLDRADELRRGASGP